jgi:hypothetical protein
VNTNRLVLTTALRRRGLEKQKNGDEAVARAATVTFLSLARERRRCRVLNDAYEAAENKPEVRQSIEETVRHLRELHAMLPARLRKKSWITTIEYFDAWTLETRKSA